MSTIVDTQNVVNSLEEAPDQLRGEVGTYLSEVPTSIIGPFASRTSRANAPFTYDFKNFSSGVKNHYIRTVADNNQTLFPTKRGTIYLSGVEQAFRDQDQWQDYMRQTILVGTSFLDHQFNLDLPDQTAGKLIKNYHHPEYENVTKEFPSNQLVNYNLVSYPFKPQASDVSKIGDIRTEFDDENFSAGVTLEFDEFISQYRNRISNYTGSVEELSVKQRHIFDLQQPRVVGFEDMDPIVLNGPTFPIESTPSDVAPVPFYYSKTLPFIGSSVSLEGRLFSSIIDSRQKRKNIFQSIKQDLSFANRQFRIGTEDVNAKIYNLINIMSSSRIADFKIGEDEIFLLPEDEISNSHESDRFLNQVNAVRFLGRMREFINSNSRGYEQVINSTPCKTFFLGYKIEKYIDNDATQPIQTYYTNDPVFYDTQIKYGRKYIYKIKILIGILGSSYVYSDLAVSQNENQMVNAEGQVITTTAPEYGDIINEKYRAYVNFEVAPSFQVLEYAVDEEQTRFVDDIPNAPQVYFYNQPHKPTTEFFFSPMYEDRDGIDDSIRFQYFNGVYEIYRLDEAPSSMEDFEDAFLTTVDDQTTLTNVSDEIPDYLVENMNGHYEDKIVQNQKYYYAFKSVTYHGVKSEFTVPFEVEMLKDSDEFKVVVEEYQFPQVKDHTLESTAKRIMKITPNIERLFFSEEENKVDWKLDEANMLAKNQTTKFKIRVTSKHTGKKMDINLNFFLDDKTNT